MGIGRTFASRIGGGGVIFSAPRICKLFAHPNKSEKFTMNYYLKEKVWFRSKRKKRSY